VRRPSLFLLLLPLLLLPPLRPECPERPLRSDDDEDDAVEVEPVVVCSKTCTACPVLGFQIRTVASRELIIIIIIIIIFK